MLVSRATVLNMWVTTPTGGGGQMTLSQGSPRPLENTDSNDS